MIVGKFVDIRDPGGSRELPNVRVTLDDNRRVHLRRSIFSQVSLPLDKLEEAIAALKAEQAS